jgi:hypothetical protein
MVIPVNKLTKVRELAKTDARSHTFQRGGSKSNVLFFENFGTMMCREYHFFLSQKKSACKKKGKADGR